MHTVFGRLLAVVLVLLPLTACVNADPSGTEAAQTPTSTTAAPAPRDALGARDYWPTQGWRTAAPQDHGIDPVALAKVEQRVAESYTQVRSVLVVRHGYLVYEHYWQGVDAADGHDVRSVTKSVVSALIGIAIAEGHIASVEQTVGELLAAQLPKDADPRLAGVTVKQLLTMTSGLAGDDQSLGADPRVGEAMIRSEDWVRHILSRPLETEPGTKFAYSSATSHLLAAIVANATGQSTLAYARTNLFDPLGIRTTDAFEPVITDPIPPATLTTYQQSSVAWPTDPQGYHYGGAFLRLPARDLAKFGYLYLNGGHWDGNQLVPAEYVRASTLQDGSPSNASSEYGWQWWVATERSGHRAFFARGYGSQFIHVVPDLDLVTVITSDPDLHRNDAQNLITRTIIPAVTP